MDSERAANYLIFLPVFLWRCLGLVLVVGAISPVFAESRSVDWWEVAKTAGIAAAWFHGWNPNNLLVLSRLGGLGNKS